MKARLYAPADRSGRTALQHASEKTPACCRCGTAAPWDLPPPGSAPGTAEYSTFCVRKRMKKRQKRKKTHNNRGYRRQLVGKEWEQGCPAWCLSLKCISVAFAPVPWLSFFSPLRQAFMISGLVSH